ncbi:MAG: hypothetical protein QF707_04330 [Candidatus Poseidoniaceae archaeon]|jgi:hypothetical protein|nr:hypothetical protein [Candidatus Poseidoniaceae archaeon]
MVRGPWSSIPVDDILPLATGQIESLTVIFEGRENRIGRPAGIRALPRLVSGPVQEMHAALVQGLSAENPELRMASIEVFPVCAMRQSEALFDILAELLDDDILMVRQAASKCLGEIAPDFPSGTDTLLHIELRHEIKNRRVEAWKGLRALCQRWPEVAADHIDRLIREEEVALRRDAASLLARLVKRSGAKIWDLIIWSLQDEDDEVRRRAANTLRPLAEHHPKVALLMAESALFDSDEKVRAKVLKCLTILDSSSMRLKTLISDGCRVADVEVRRACIAMIPRLYSQDSARDLATELLKQETDAGLRKELEELIVDQQLEGDERTKNAFLAPAEPVPARDREIIASMEDAPMLDESQMMLPSKSEGPADEKSSGSMRQD